MQKIGIIERIVNLYDDFFVLQVLLGVILLDDVYGFFIEVFIIIIESLIIFFSLGIKDLFKFIIVFFSVQSVVDVVDCGIIVIDLDFCVKYKLQCVICVQYIDKNKGDIFKRGKKL